MTRNLEALVVEAKPKSGNNPYTYSEARHGYTNNSETILLCNRCACNLKIDSQRILVQLAFTDSTLWRRHELHKKCPASEPCETDVLCNWELIQNNNKCACNHFGPHCNWELAAPRTIVSP